jgi:methionine-rich copper-binding protein CopC
MKPLALWAELALTTYAAVALAHAHLQNSTPADGGVLDSSPAEVVLTFSEAARLTGAWIQRAGDTKEKLQSLPQKAAREVKVPLPVLTPGAYIVSWRAISDDGHVVPGQIRFTVGTQLKMDPGTASPPAQP